ncbi:MAG: SAM-dependent methyltransferase [Betaproteobacteria bacterium]
MRKIYRILLLAVVLGWAGRFDLAFGQDPAALANTVVSAPERSPEDRALDAGRKPAELLAFLGIQPGWRIADLGTAGGYTTELLERAVGAEGVIYGQNSKVMLEKFAEKPWSARLAKPVMKAVVRLDRDFDDPFPADIAPLDAVTIVLFYHDTVWLEVNREAMNKAVFAALKPGGVFLVVDHSARPGDGVKVAASFHRIEESVVKAEVEAAGFALDKEADFLRNSTDTRDWNDSPRASGDRRGTSDRFVLLFRKPK